jgi:peptide/nickel transport system substrate-binding protein
MRHVIAPVPVLALVALLLAAPIGATSAGAAPEGQMVWAVHISLAPVYFEPAEAPGIITPFMLYYALHDALVKPMPGNTMTPSLAESWTESPDGLTYEFVLRRGVKFHNGDPLTADDVKFSFERYRGVAAKSFKTRVSAVDVVDPHRVRFRLARPWPDFMTFYGTPATGAGWIVPKKYVERVGDDGFKKAPVGAGPYRFVSFTPGVEVVVEAFDGYWRKTPSVKRLIFKSVPEESTRLAMLKRGEADVAYSIRGVLAEELKRTPGLVLKPSSMPWTQWVQFTAEQWDARSPWADRRVRLAANLALDRQAINQAEFLGISKITGSIIPHSLDFYWSPPVYAHDPARARRLLAEAGYPNGFDGGTISSDMVYASLAEAVANYLGPVGIRLKVAPMERAAVLLAAQEKKLRGLNVGGSAAFGNAATRIEAYVAAAGMYTYGSHADIEGLFQEQAAESDRKRREVALHKIQQLMHERAMFVPLMEPALLNGYGPRVAEAGLGLISVHAYSAPYEEVRLKTPGR